MAEQKLNINEDLIAEIEDLKSKLDDCLEALNAGKELDPMQNALINSLQIN